MLHLSVISERGQGANEYMIELSRQFPGAKGFILAVGGAGEDGTKVEHVLDRLWISIGNCSIFTCDDDAHPRHNWGGNLDLLEHRTVEFVGGAVQLHDIPGVDLHHFVPRSV